MALLEISRIDNVLNAKNREWFWLKWNMREAPSQHNGVGQMNNWHFEIMFTAIIWGNQLSAGNGSFFIETEANDSVGVNFTFECSGSL